MSENSFFTSTSLPSIITYFARPLPVHTPPKPAPWVIPTVLGFFIFQLSDIENLAKNLSPQKLAKISQIYTRKNYFSKKNPQFFSWRGKKTKNKKKKSQFAATFPSLIFLLQIFWPFPQNYWANFKILCLGNCKISLIFY